MVGIVECRAMLFQFVKSYVLAYIVQKIGMKHAEEFGVVYAVYVQFARHRVIIGHHPALRVIYKAVQNRVLVHLFGARIFCKITGLTANPVAFRLMVA